MPLASGAVEKVVYVLWRDEGTPVEAWSAALRTSGADALPGCGALGVQVNVADGAVASGVSEGASPPLSQPSTASAARAGKIRRSGRAIAQC